MNNAAQMLTTTVAVRQFMNDVLDIHHEVRLALMQGYATAANGGLGQHAINIPLWQADAYRIPLVCSL
jgi:hypothetical protein